MADLVVRGAQIYRMAPARSWAEALAARDGRLVYVGTDSGAAAFIGPGTRVLDLGGQMVLPGLHDNHVHPVSAGLELGEAYLYDAKTSDQIERILREYLAANPGDGWVRGNGWQLPVFPNANPSKQWLDRIVPDRPAFLYAMDGHSALVNSKALELAGVNRSTKDPVNGRIERSADGEPSGTLRESAMDLVRGKLPDYTGEQQVDAARRAIAEANRYGITALTDADATTDYLDAYAALERLGPMNAEIVIAMSSGSGSAEEEVQRFKAIRRQYESPHMQLESVKLYADGVLEAGTAAVLEPYIGKLKGLGTLNYEPADFQARVAALDRAGFQIHVHAIGDRGIRETLNAFEFTERQNGRRDSRHIIAHLELIDPTDIGRFQSLRVIASFQAFWAQPDEYITTLTEPELGPARSKWLYPIGSVMRTGAVVVGGSDWSVSSLNPLDAIEIAITRRSLDSLPGKAWLPEQQVGLEQMLAAYTINGAWANRQERERGSLEVGKSADFVVLDHNLFSIPVTDIHKVKVLRTFFEGREVYESKE